MPGAYTSVRGTALADLIHETRLTFLAGPPVAAYDPQLPNSLQLVALETFTKKARPDKLKILGDAIDTDTDVPIEREAVDVFVHASTTGAYLEDLICEIVCQELYKDVAVRVEDSGRRALR